MGSVKIGNLGFWLRALASGNGKLRATHLSFGKYVEPLVIIPMICPIRGTFG